MPPVFLAASHRADDDSSHAHVCAELNCTRTVVCQFETVSFKCLRRFKQSTAEIARAMHDSLDAQILVVEAEENQVSMKRSSQRFRSNT